MLRTSFFLLTISAALLTSTSASAQARANAPAGKKTGTSGKTYTAQPARTSTKPTADDGGKTTASPANDPKMEPLMETQGEYVAPGMSGAPRTRVDTDYEGRPEKKTTGSSTLSS